MLLMTVILDQRYCTGGNSYSSDDEDGDEAAAAVVPAVVVAAAASPVPAAPGADGDAAAHFRAVLYSVAIAQ